MRRRDRSQRTYFPVETGQHRFGLAGVGHNAGRAVKKFFPPGRWKKLIAYAGFYPHLHDDDFVREHLDEWLG
jgi:hypothetical protein